MKIAYYSLTCDNCDAYHMDAETESVMFKNADFMVSQAKSYGWRINKASCICHVCLKDTVSLITNKPAAVTAGL